MSDFKDSVRHAMRQQDSQPAAHQPDFEAIAAFADGNLRWWQRRRVTRHLSDCDQCRRLWLELAAERDLHEAPEGQAGVERAGLWPALAAVAGLAAAVVVLVFVGQTGSHNTPQTWFARAPEVPITAPWQDAETTVYRSVVDPLPAVALSPRWSITPEVTPTLRWRLADRLSVEHAEVMVIDEQETLVAVWEVDADAGHTAWPDAAPSLDAAGEYAWKLTVWTVDGPATTPFQPFVVAPGATAGPADVDEPEARLAALIEHGRFDQAWLELAESPQSLAPAERRQVATELAGRLRWSEAERALFEGQP